MCSTTIIFSKSNVNISPFLPETQKKLITFLLFLIPMYDIFSQKIFDQYINIFSQFFYD